MSSAFGGVGSRSVRASAVMLDSGIVVLHGDTGEGVWNHLAPRNRGSPVGLTADGSAFLVAHGADGDRSPERDTDTRRGHRYR